MFGKLLLLLQLEILCKVVSLLLAEGVIEGLCYRLLKLFYFLKETSLISDFDCFKFGA